MLALLATLCLAPAAPAQESIPPGQEGRLEIPGCKYPCLLYVPEDYRPGARLPLILFMHGSGGKPTSWPWRSATGGRGYLIVGLSYGPLPQGGAGGIQSDPKSRIAMHRFIEQVRELVDERYGVDQERVLLSGLSMGGWGVTYYGFLDEARGRYYGYCIIAAGSSGRGTGDLSVIKGLPVLLLNGAQDGNLASAERGRVEYEAAGARVEQVVLPGEGHVPATGKLAPALRKWLNSVEKEAARERALSAVRWKPRRLKGRPSRDRASGGRDLHSALSEFLAKQDFMKEADAGRPVLIYGYSTRRRKNARPTRAARDSAAAERTLFSFPEACAVPAATWHFSCFKIDLSRIDKKQDPFFHEGAAPLVILLDGRHAVAEVLAKSRVRERPLLEAMKRLISADEIAEIDARATQTRPLLAAMQKLEKKRKVLRKAVAKLEGGKSRKKLARKREELLALDRQYEELRNKLLQ